jgi:hypothetical protein
VDSNIRVIPLGIAGQHGQESAITAHRGDIADVLDPCLAVRPVNDDQEVDRDRGPLLLAEMTDDAAQDHGSTFAMA